jgi:hypothetical protein
VHGAALFLTQNICSRLIRRREAHILVTVFHVRSSKEIAMRRIVAIALSSSLLLQVAPLMAAPARHGTRAAGVQDPSTGAIQGIAQNSAGHTLPNYTVQLRNLQTGQLSGVTTSNSAGSFSFAGLSPANYVVEVVNQAGVIVGSSAAIPVAAGATASVAVSTTAAAIAGAAAGGAAGGISTAVVVTTVAAAAGVAGVVVIARRNASPSR